MQSNIGGWVGRGGGGGDQVPHTVFLPFVLTFWLEKLQYNTLNENFKDKLLVSNY